MIEIYDGKGDKTSRKWSIKGAPVDDLIAHVKPLYSQRKTFDALRRGGVVQDLIAGPFRRERCYEGLTKPILKPGRGVHQ